jgi:hypothetical protein
VTQGSAAHLDVSCAEQIHLPPFLTQAQVDHLPQKSNGKH